MVIDGKIEVASVERLRAMFEAGEIGTGGFNRSAQRARRSSRERPVSAETEQSEQANKRTSEQANKRTSEQDCLTGTPFAVSVGCNR
jgi:hypothetical protein